jgi:hypothetical protein
MKKGLIGLVLGIIIGAAATLAVPAYAAIKQYILTEYTQPVVVNGKVYSDPEYPILAYNGRTYLPLAKVGELLGAPVRYNDQLKRVEIGAAAPTYEEVTVVEKDISGGQTSAPAATDGPAGRKNDYLKPDTDFVEEEEPGYKGYPDSADPSYQWALHIGREDMPPLMSEGWISQAMLHEIEGVRINGTGTPGEFYFYRQANMKETVLLTVQLPEEFYGNKSGVTEATINGIRMIYYYGNLFFNIDDLRNAGII